MTTERAVFAAFILRRAQDEGVGEATIPQQQLPLILEFFA
jgi:hypothetical protein